jgi:predicted phage-related endonuclease
LGLSPYVGHNAASVYWSKVADQPNEPTEAMRTGNRLEGPLIDFACEELGVQAIRNQFRVETYHGKVLAANIDGLVKGRREAIECKYVGPQGAADWGEPGTDEVPAHVIAQCQHQAHVADLDCVWVAAAIASYTLEWRLYRVPRHDPLITAMVERLRAFWANHILPRIPPTDEPAPMDLLKAMRREPASVTDLPASCVELVSQWEHAKEAQKTADEEEDEIKRRLIAMLGEGEVGRLSDGRMLTYLSQRGNPRFDAKRFRAVHPDLWGVFSEETNFRVLRIKKGK